MLSIRAIYDGRVFVPQEPIDLPKNTICTVSAKTSNSQKRKAKVDAGQAFTALLKKWDKEPEALPQLPKDYAKEIDHYLYGTPKRKEPAGLKGKGKLGKKRGSHRSASKKRGS